MLAESLQHPSARAFGQHVLAMESHGFNSKTTLDRYMVFFKGSNVNYAIHVVRPDVFPSESFTLSLCWRFRGPFLESTCE